MAGATVVDMAVEDWWTNGTGPLARVTGGGTRGVMGMVVETTRGSDSWWKGGLQWEAKQLLEEGLGGIR